MQSILAQLKTLETTLRTTTDASGQPLIRTPHLDSAAGMVQGAIDSVRNHVDALKTLATAAHAEIKNAGPAMEAKVKDAEALTAAAKAAMTEEDAKAWAEAVSKLFDAMDK